MDCVIRLENVSKRFRLYRQKHYSLKENVLTFFRDRGTWEDFWALKSIDLEVPRGQMLGIIGENGSGKSTCLKLLARILSPDTGKVEVKGSVSALIELGAGFQPDFTGRENVYLNGSILGFTRKEIDERFDDIVRFAELERFIDSPVKTYSSGMYMRLGFSIATHVDPDVLLIDEILAVGDEPFQAKCLDRISRFREAGKTIVFVSHALGAVESLCDRVVVLQRGRIIADGPPRDAIERYKESLGMATRVQCLVPGLEGMPQPVAQAPAHVEARLTSLEDRVSTVERRISSPVSVENAVERIVQLEQAMSIVQHQGDVRDQAIRDLATEMDRRWGILAEADQGSVRTLLEKLSWIERRVSEPIAIENVRERLVQLEESLGVVHQQDGVRDKALMDLSARINGLERRIATFFAEGLAVVPVQYGTRDIVLTGARFFDRDGNPCSKITSGDPLTIHIGYRMDRPVEDPVFGFGFRDQRGSVVFGTNTQLDGATLSLYQEGTVKVYIPRVCLLAGLFYVSFSVHSPDHTVQYHRLENCYSLLVEPRRIFDGRVDMECHWSSHPLREVPDEQPVRPR